MGIVSCTASTAVGANACHGREKMYASTVLTNSEAALKVVYLDAQADDKVVIVGTGSCKPKCPGMCADRCRLQLC